MLKEAKGVEYTVEILKAFHRCPGEHDAKYISELVKWGDLNDVSSSYIAKVLSKMKKTGILSSSDSGYKLNIPISQITVKNVLEVSSMPDVGSYLHPLCEEILKAVSTKSITEVYEFK